MASHYAGQLCPLWVGSSTQALGAPWHQGVVPLPTDAARPPSPNPCPSHPYGCMARGLLKKQPFLYEPASEVGPAGGLILQVGVEAHPRGMSHFKGRRRKRNYLRNNLRLE